MPEIHEKFARLEDAMNRMFEELWGVPASRNLLLPAGGRYLYPGLL